MATDSSRVKRYGLPLPFLILRGCLSRFASAVCHNGSICNTNSLNFSGSMPNILPNVFGRCLSFKMFMPSLYNSVKLYSAGLFSHSVVRDELFSPLFQFQWPFRSSRHGHLPRRKYFATQKSLRAQKRPLPRSSTSRGFCIIVLRKSKLLKTPVGYVLHVLIYIIRVKPQNASRKEVLVVGGLKIHSLYDDVADFVRKFRREKVRIFLERGMHEVNSKFQMQ